MKIQIFAALSKYKLNLQFFISLIYKQLILFSEWILKSEKSSSNSEDWFRSWFYLLVLHRKMTTIKRWERIKGKMESIHQISFMSAVLKERNTPKDPKLPFPLLQSKPSFVEQNSKRIKNFSQKYQYWRIKKIWDHKSLKMYIICSSFNNCKNAHRTVFNF